MVEVDVGGDAVDEAGMQAYVGLYLLFPAEVGVGELAVVEALLAAVLRVAEEGEVGVVAHFGVTRGTHADVEHEVAQPAACAHHELFHADVPLDAAAVEEGGAVLATEA